MRRNKEWWGSSWSKSRSFCIGASSKGPAANTVFGRHIRWANAVPLPLLPPIQLPRSQMRLTSSVTAAVVSAIQKTRVAPLETQSVVPLLLPYLLRLTGWCYSLGVTGSPLEVMIRLTLLELYELSYGRAGHLPAKYFSTWLENWHCSIDSCKFWWMLQFSTVAI